VKFNSHQSLFDAIASMAYRTIGSVTAGIVLGALISASLTGRSASSKLSHVRGKRSLVLANEFSAPLLDHSARLAELKKAQPDIAAVLPLRFDLRLKTPCFANGTAMRCLPAFFLSGAMQCGTSDMWRRLTVHEQIASEHDALSHWWTLHPRSMARGRLRDFNQYLDLYSAPRTLAMLERAPGTLLGEASPATFTYMMAEQLRLHHLYLDAFSACWGKCRSSTCKAGCYDVANAATVTLEFNLPSLIATTYSATRLPKLIALLRDPSVRLWIAFWSYGQYPAKYGQSVEGFGYYFGNQSAAFHACTQAYGRRRCALRFEAYGAAEANVYYHCDQLIKGMYAAFLPEWVAALGAPNLLVMRTEAYLSRPIQTLKRALRHLGLRAPTEAEARRMQALESSDELRRVEREHGMPPATSLKLLRRFYLPFNRALASMLDDDGFLWQGQRDSSRES
jgi:N-acetylgalactosamine 4-sulfate 6-O-sulfotransferase